MSYTLAEAAQATGLNQSTILLAINSGRISGTRDEFDGWRIEPVESIEHSQPPRQGPIQCCRMHNPIPSCGLGLPGPSSVRGTQACLAANMTYGHQHPFKEEVLAGVGK